MTSTINPQVPNNTVSGVNPTPESSTKINADGKKYIIWTLVIFSVAILSSFFTYLVVTSDMVNEEVNPINVINTNEEDQNQLDEAGSSATTTQSTTSTDQPQSYEPTLQAGWEFVYQSDCDITFTRPVDSSWEIADGTGNFLGYDFDRRVSNTNSNETDPNFSQVNALCGKNTEVFDVASFYQDYKTHLENNISGIEVRIEDRYEKWGQEVYEVYIETPITTNDNVFFLVVTDDYYYQVDKFSTSESQGTINDIFDNLYFGRYSGN